MNAVSFKIEERLCLGADAFIDVFKNFKRMDLCVAYLIDEVPAFKAFVNLLSFIHVCDDNAWHPILTRHSLIGLCKCNAPSGRCIIPLSGFQCERRLPFLPRRLNSQLMG